MMHSELSDSLARHFVASNVLRSLQAYKLHEKVEAKMAADADFDKAAFAAEHDREKRDAEIQNRVRQQQAQYWSWLRGMKERVDAP